MDERTPAEQQLQEHYRAGRLTMRQLEERSTRASVATTAAELDELFSDLPGGYVSTMPGTYQQWPTLGGTQPYSHQEVRVLDPGPQPGPRAAGGWAQPPAPQQEVIPAAGRHPRSPQERARRKSLAALIQAITWPAAIILGFATDWSWWWLFLVAIFVMPVITNWLRKD